MSLQSIVPAEERKITTWPAKYCKCDNTLEATMSVFANQNKYYHKWTAVTRKSHTLGAFSRVKKAHNIKVLIILPRFLLYMYVTFQMPNFKSCTKKPTHWLSQL